MNTPPEPTVQQLLKDLKDALWGLALKLRQKSAALAENGDFDLADGRLYSAEDLEDILKKFES